MRPFTDDNTGSHISEDNKKNQVESINKYISLTTYFLPKIEI